MMRSILNLLFANTLVVNALTVRPPAPRWRGVRTHGSRLHRCLGEAAVSDHQLAKAAVANRTKAQKERCGQLEP